MKTLEESVFLALCQSSLRSLNVQKAFAAHGVNTAWVSLPPYKKDRILQAGAWILNTIPGGPEIYHEVLYVAALFHLEGVETMAVDLAAMGLSGGYIERVRQVVLDSKHLKDPKTEEGKCLADADLAFLSGPVEDAWQSVCKPWRLNGQNPKDLLTRLVERPRIYLCPYMSREEFAARQNIGDILGWIDSGLLGQMALATATLTA